MTTLPDFRQISGGSLEKEEKSRSSSDATPNLDALLAVVDELSKSDGVDPSTKSNLAQVRILFRHHLLSFLISLSSPKVAELRSSGWPEPKKSVAEEESASKKKSHAIAITAPPDMKTPTSAAAADKKEDGDAKKGDAKANAGNGQQPVRFFFHCLSIFL